MRALVEAIAPRPLARDALASRFAIDATTLDSSRRKPFGERARAGAGLGDVGWIGRARLEGLVAKARDLVRTHHEEAPLTPGLPLETLRARLAVGGGRLVAEEAIRVACTGGDAAHRLTIEGDIVRMPQTKSAGNAEAIARTHTIASALREAGTTGATEFMLSERASGGSAELRATLQKLARDGAAMRLGDLWLAQEVLDDARRKMVEHFASASTLSVIEFKKITGFARKQAVLVLEHFDSVGLTRRQGDARVLR